MRLVKFNDFVRASNFFYYTLGFKPYVEPGILDNKRTLLEKIIYVTGFVNMNMLLIGEVIFIAKSLMKNEEFLQCTLTMTYIGFIAIGEIKMLSVWRKKQKLTDLVCELHEIFPQNIREQEVYHIQRYLRQCTIWTTSFSVLYVLLIWIYNLSAITQWLIYDYLLNVRTIRKNIPYPMYTPWDWNDHWSYFLVYALQSFGGYTATAGQISSDLLLCAIAIQVTMHYDHVSRSIENYDLEANEFTMKPTEHRRQHENDLKFLRNIIAYHAKVLNLSHLVNDIFGVPLIFNFMIASIVICFVGFLLTIENTTAGMQFKLFLYLFSSTMQVYLICHIGQLLIDVSTNVAQATYNHNCHNADVPYKKMLVLIALRAQKPSYLTATQLVVISRNTLTIIMQMSYKVFAVLRRMYVE